jgi:hypothetical protein
MPTSRKREPWTAQADPQGIGDIVDLDRYPIDRPSSTACRELVAQARASLADPGAFVLEGFLRPTGLASVLGQADAMAANAFHSSSPHNVLLVPPDPAYPPDHARNRLVRSDKSVLADDQLPTDSPLRRIYTSDHVRAFLCAALGVESLYPFEDPLAPINVSFYGEGEELGWHFDNSPFAVTLLLRDAATGGIFEYVPNLRGDTPEAYAALSRILDGDQQGVRELRQSRGALVLFKGARSLHRVTPCGGPIPRTIAVLSYSPAPGRSLEEHTRLLFYGRRV